MMELMHMDVVSHILNSDPPNTEKSSTGTLNKFNQEYAIAQSYIVLNISENPSTQITSLVLNGESTKVVWNKLKDTCQNENIQPKLSFPAKLHNIKI